MEKASRIGLIGCGAISGAYLNTCRGYSELKIVACADINRATAEKKAAEFGVERVLGAEEMLADRSIDIILNLTTPKSHANVTLAALNSGKHVYTEKPLAVSEKELRTILAKAKAKKRMVAGAPDTVLGVGIQTARKAIDDGLIGRPVAFTAFMMGPGHESWHANPEFFYESGGGPMLDMGPYYIATLLNLLGPVKRIGAQASVAIPVRTVTSQPKFGKKIKVQTPDHICGTMEFTGGAVGSIIMSFATRYPQYDGRWPITIFGTEGTLLVPDPNRFDGIVKLRREFDTDFTELPGVFSCAYDRGIGLLDMVQALREKRKPRCGIKQIATATEIMFGFLKSAKTGKVITVKGKYSRPRPMAAD